VYGRLLRYVYVGDLFVNRALVEQGYAEAVLYEPDHAHYNEFVQLEKEAASGNRGCHPSGIFNDGSYTR
jgi:micrococcal nuclease